MKSFLACSVISSRFAFRSFRSSTDSTPEKASFWGSSQVSQARTLSDIATDNDPRRPPRNGNGKQGLNCPYVFFSGRRY